MRLLKCGGEGCREPRGGRGVHVPSGLANDLEIPHDRIDRHPIGGNVSGAQVDDSDKRRPCADGGAAKGEVMRDDNSGLVRGRSRRARAGTQRSGASREHTAFRRESAGRKR